MPPEEHSDSDTVVNSAPLAELQEIPADPNFDDDEEEQEELRKMEATTTSAAAGAVAAETNTDTTVAKPSSAEDSIFSIMYAVAKKVAIVGSIYLVGYMGWSVAWLIAPVVLSVARDRFRKSTEHKRSIAKASALASEKEVIMARIDELPAWVSGEKKFVRSL